MFGIKSVCSSVFVISSVSVWCQLRVQALFIVRCQLGKCSCSCSVPSNLAGFHQCSMPSTQEVPTSSTGEAFFGVLCCRPKFCQFCVALFIMHANGHCLFVAERSSIGEHGQPNLEPAPQRKWALFHIWSRCRQTDAFVSRTRRFSDHPIDALWVGPDSFPTIKPTPLWVGSDGFPTIQSTPCESDPTVFRPSNRRLCESDPTIFRPSNQMNGSHVAYIRQRCCLFYVWLIAISVVALCCCGCCCSCRFCCCCRCGGGYCCGGCGCSCCCGCCYCCGCSCRCCGCSLLLWLWLLSLLLWLLFVVVVVVVVFVVVVVVVVIVVVVGILVSRSSLVPPALSPIIDRDVPDMDDFSPIGKSSHSIKNLAFHRWLRWKMIIHQLSLTHTFLFKRSGRMYFLNFGVKRLSNLRKLQGLPGNPQRWS